MASRLMQECMLVKAYGWVQLRSKPTRLADDANTTATSTSRLHTRSPRDRQCGMLEF